jgi:hypothetical protein
MRLKTAPSGEPVDYGNELENNMSERQTISYLQKRLRESGVTPQARLGRTF